MVLGVRAPPEVAANSMRNRAGGAVTRLLEKLFAEAVEAVGSCWFSWAVLLEDPVMPASLVNLAVLIGGGGAQDLVVAEDG